MVSGDLELQAAMSAHLAADPNVQAVLGNPARIYQDVPTEGPNGATTFPYATLGETTETDDSTQCGTASDILAHIEVWSRATGFEEVKNIASAIRLSLHNAELTLATDRC